MMIRLCAALAASLLAAGALVIRFRRPPKPAAAVVQPHVPADCFFDGKQYYSGESLPSLDHCNAFGCQDGRIISTAMACSHGRTP